MKQSITTLLTVFLFSSAFAQKIIPGDYGDGLKLSFDSTTKKVTGYFENYSGIDEQNSNPRFSCIFYIEGTATGQKFTIQTFYPTNRKDDVIQGTMEIITDKKVNIKLPKEHGGCWNVQDFAAEPVVFTLYASQKWRQIRYIDVAKAYFYNDKSESKRLKPYLVKGNFVFIEKIEGQSAYCTYIGKKTIRGWIKLLDMNVL